MLSECLSYNKAPCTCALAVNLNSQACGCGPCTHACGPPTYYKITLLLSSFLTPNGCIGEYCPESRSANISMVQQRLLEFSPSVLLAMKNAYNHRLHQNALAHLRLPKLTL